MRMLLRFTRRVAENPYLQFGGAICLVIAALFEVTESAFEHAIENFTGIDWAAPQGLIIYGSIVALRFFSDILESIERIERGRRRKITLHRRHPALLSSHKGAAPDAVPQPEERAS